MQSAPGATWRLKEWENSHISFRLAAYHHMFPSYAKTMIKYLIFEMKSLHIMNRLLIHGPAEI